ncbi:MAG TPA: signal peptidase I [Gammaproteobacteria bacterium]|nr:signal peptidase I [Gammaproteobacteria bacterium]
MAQPRLRAWFSRNRGFFLFLLCLAFFRTSVADWNPVPTGSMRPTILEGDVVLVNRLAYDLKVPLTHIALARLGEPQRGDVVTFDSPADGTRLVKRLVAVPGDVVEVRDDVLSINGQMARYSDFGETDESREYGFAMTADTATESVAGGLHAVQFLRGVSKRDFGPEVVPADHYFMMGDNRDNSADSRYFGFVPRELLVGHAHHILVSADIKGHWMPRFDRVGRKLE